MIPPEPRTERLLLRQWRPDDAEGLAEIYAQPEFLEHNPARDPHEHVARFARAWEEEGFGLWAVEDPESGRFIGRIGLLRHHDWPESESPVEVGRSSIGTGGDEGSRPKEVVPFSSAGASTWTTRS